MRVKLEDSPGGEVGVDNSAEELVDEAVDERIEGTVRGNGLVGRGTSHAVAARLLEDVAAVQEAVLRRHERDEGIHHVVGQGGAGGVVAAGASVVVVRA